MPLCESDLCEKIAKFLCDRCRSTVYCSKKCQSNAFSAHRKICFEIPKLVEINTSNSICEDGIMDTSNNSGIQAQQFDNDKRPKQESVHSIEKSAAHVPVKVEKKASKVDEKPSKHEAVEEQVKVKTLPKPDIKEADSAPAVKPQTQPAPAAKPQTQPAPAAKPQIQQAAEKPKEISPSGASQASESFNRLRLAHMTMKSPPRQWPNVQEKRRFFFRDLKVRPLPKGVVSVIPYNCDFGQKLLVVLENCQKNRDDLEMIGGIVKQVIAEDKLTSYEPQKGEIVLGKYEGEFYRAHCTEITEAGFVLDYIDYGNVAVVNKSDIRPFDAKLDLERFVHICYVENLPSDPNEKVCQLFEPGVIEFETLKRDADGVYTVRLVGL